MKTFSIIKIFLLALFLLFHSLPLVACSEIFISDDYKISARNFDFMFGNGVAVMTPQGITQQSFFTDKNGWKSKYGSIIFCVELPIGNKTGKFILAGVDGMNEHGFKAGSYFLSVSEFQKEDKRPVIAVTELVQYYLDNFKTVAEAVAFAASEKYRIAPVSTDIGEIKLHLYMHDPSGDSVILEYVNSKLKLYRNPSVRVLTNSTYEESLAALKNYEDFGGKKHIPGGTGSLERFVRGAYYLKHLSKPKLPEEAVAYGFDTIQILTTSPGFEHGCTQWTIVSNITSKKIFFRTANNPNISYFDLNTLDFSENHSKRTLNFLKTNLHGNVNNLLITD